MQHWRVSKEAPTGPGLRPSGLEGPGAPPTPPEAPGPEGRGAELSTNPKQLSERRP